MYIRVIHESNKISWKFFCMLSCPSASDICYHSHPYWRRYYLADWNISVLSFLYIFRAVFGHMEDCINRHLRWPWFAFLNLNKFDDAWKFSFWDRYDHAVLAFSVSIILTSRVKSDPDPCFQYFPLTHGLLMTSSAICILKWEAKSLLKFMQSSSNHCIYIPDAIKPW